MAGTSGLMGIGSGDYGGLGGLPFGGMSAPGIGPGAGAFGGAGGFGSMYGLPTSPNTTLGPGY